MEMPWYSVCSFLLCFLFRSSVRKGYLDESYSRPVTIMVIFSIMPFQSYLITAMLKFLLKITRHIYYSILKDTLEKVPRRCLKNYHLRKNVTPHFKDHCTKVYDISLVVIRLFFSQITLVFKFNPA